MLTSARLTTRLALTLIVALFWAGSAARAVAAERAWISTDGVLSYAGTDWIAEGGVRLVQGEIEIRADRLRYVVDQDLVYFDGNVVMTEGDDHVTGASFVYNLETETGTLESAKVSYNVDGIADPVHLLGRMVDIASDHVVVHGGRFTTCLPVESPGYYLQSRRIDIYPGERIVIRNVRFVESGITLFYWPYVSISLRQDRPSRIHFPEIGRNSEDGWYARFTHGYDGPGDGYGEAVLDVTQYRGVGMGVNHTYRDRSESKGSLTAYRLANRATGHDDLAFSLKESFLISDRLKAELEAVYLTEAGETASEDREAQLQIGLDHSTSNTSTYIDWAGLVTRGSVAEETGRGMLDHSGRVGGLNWRLDVDTFTHQRDGVRLKETLSYLATATQRGTGYTLQLALEQRVPSSLLTRSSSSPSWRRISRAPEANLTLDLQRLLTHRLPVEIGVGYGRFAEERKVGSEYVETAADRMTTAFRLKPGALSLGSLGRLNYRAGAEVRQYSTGHRRWILTADHQYRLSLGRSWSFLTTYSYREALGDSSPFVHVDSVSEHERVSGRLQYLSGRGSISLSSGYDFRNGRLLDLVGQASYRPDSRLTLSLQGAYSLAEQRPTSAAGSLSFRPMPGWTMSGSARYSFTRNDLDRVQASISLDHMGWRFDYSAIYNGVTDLFVAGEAALVRDLGCREVGVRYDPVDGAFWLEYRITALPGSPVRVGANRQRLLFDSDAILEMFD